MATKHTDGCFHKAEDDEPLFTLLARDPIAPGLVRRWAVEAERAGKSAERVEDARRVADEMEDWRRKNRPDESGSALERRYLVLINDIMRRAHSLAEVRLLSAKSSDWESTFEGYNAALRELQEVGQALREKSDA